MPFLDIPTYVLCNMMCIAILTVLSYQSSRQYRILRDERLFLEVMLASIIMFLSDIIWYFVDGKPGFFNRVINVISCASYLLMTVAVSFVLLVYIDYKFCKRTENQFIKRIFFYAVPLMIFVLLLTTSQITHLVFFIDEHNNYNRGPLYFIQLALSVAYVGYAAVLAHLAARFLHRSKAVRKEIFSLTVFSLMALAGGVLQVFMVSVPVLAMTLTVSVLFIYLNVQSKQIYIDTLCGINNRRQFNMYIESVLKSKRRKTNVYLLMMDIDKFKLINDTYGHTEGDYALVRVAEILSDVCAQHDDFAARYGGDEFAIVCFRKSDDEIEKLKYTILDRINISNKLSDRPYDISVSIGSALLDADNDTQESAIKKADEQLYLIKEARGHTS